MGERWKLPVLFSWEIENGEWIVRRHLGPGVSWPQWPAGIEALIDRRNIKDPPPRARVPSSRPTVQAMDGETTSTGTEDIGQCLALLAFDDGYGPESIRCSHRDGHGRHHAGLGEEWASDDAGATCAAPTPRAP